MIHINRYIDKIKMLESKQAQQFTMSMREAKDLHGDITKLLIALHEMTNKVQESQTVQKIELSGGDW